MRSSNLCNFTYRAILLDFVLKKCNIEDRDPPRLEDTPNSTCFSAVGYIDKENLLYVQFRNSGSIYAYEDVSAETYQELLDAPSMGGYYNEYIKGVYVCHRL